MLHTAWAGCASQRSWTNANRRASGQVLERWYFRVCRASRSALNSARRAADLQRSRCCGRRHERRRCRAIRCGDRRQHADDVGSTPGAGDRTRTGKPVKAADFRHTASFEAGVVGNDAVRALDYAFAVACGPTLSPVRLRRPPSSLYTFLACAARLGSALPRCIASGVSPNLKGSAPAVSGWALKLLSPLCLPISSPRQGRTGFYHCSHRRHAFDPAGPRRIRPRPHRHRYNSPRTAASSFTRLRARTAPIRPLHASSEGHKRFR